MADTHARLQAALDALRGIEGIGAIEGAGGTDPSDRTGVPNRGAALPDERQLVEFAETLRRLLLPTVAAAPAARAEAARRLGSLIDDLVRAACATSGRPHDPEAVLRFLEELPAIAARLAGDVQAAFDGDPAAQSKLEVVACYPGIRALSTHRVAHALDRLGVPLLPRMLAEHAHRETGIDIHPSASIGDALFIDHGTGVVIGQTAVIGDRCRIYQGVTLGAKSFEREPDGSMRRNYKRHPTLEDDVTVFAGATILGGDTVIGRGSVVAGSVFLTRSVPPGHVVTGPKVELRMISMGGGI